MTLTSCRSRSSSCSSAPRIHHSLSSASLAMHREAPSSAMDVAAPCSPLSRHPSRTPAPASVRWTCPMCSGGRKLEDGTQGGITARQWRRSSSNGQRDSDRRQGDSVQTGCRDTGVLRIHSSLPALVVSAVVTLLDYDDLLLMVVVALCGRRRTGAKCIVDEESPNCTFSLILSILHIRFAPSVGDKWMQLHFRSYMQNANG
jgi:hypothetical protein